MEKVYCHKKDICCGAGLAPQQMQSVYSITPADRVANTKSVLFYFILFYFSNYTYISIVYKYFFLS